MKILVISDTHGRMYHLENLLYKQKDFDRILHLGDIEDDEFYLRALVDCPVDIVGGNNDYQYDMPREKIIKIEGHTIFMTHGHYYMVRYGIDRLLNVAMQKGAEIALFGHTHVPYLNEKLPVTLLNPGSLSLPRQENRLPSYAILETDEVGRIKASIYYVE